MAVSADAVSLSLLLSFIQASVRGRERETGASGCSSSSRREGGGKNGRKNPNSRAIDAELATRVLRISAHSPASPHSLSLPLPLIESLLMCVCLCARAGECVCVRLSALAACLPPSLTSGCKTCERETGAASAAALATPRDRARKLRQSRGRERREMWEGKRKIRSAWGIELIEGARVGEREKDRSPSRDSDSCQCPFSHSSFQGCALSLSVSSVRWRNRVAITQL